MYRQKFNLLQISQRFLWNFFSCAIACTLLISVYCENSLAQNLVTNGDFGAGDLSGWLQAVSTGQSTTMSYDGTEGNPAGSALLDRTTGFTGDFGDILYQIVDVEVGAKYQVDADWKGDLFGADRNWAEFNVNFLPSNTPMPDGNTFPGSWITYKKASFGGPNEPPTEGWDWESILASPNNSSSPLDGIFTATDEWMLVGVSLGGRSFGQPAHLNVDNVSVTRMIPEPTSVALLVLGSLATVGMTRRKRR